jgi:exo-1,4-beta-D-glucosaminidase
MVTLTVPPSSKAVALFQHVSIKRFAGGEPVLPILWSDNDITLWPGESLTLTARFATRVAAKPVIEVSGWNVPTQSVPVVPAGDSLAPAGDSLANRSVASRSVAVESRTP